MVPAISLTMFLSSPKILFISEDFPTLGFPITATLILSSSSSSTESGNFSYIASKASPIPCALVEDIAIMMIDALEGVTDQDAKIAGEAHEAGKGIIIVVNKWDEYEKETGTMEKYKKDVYNKLSYLTYAPIIFISAKTGQRIDKLFDLINNVAEQNAKRISTGVLNQVINEAIALVQPPSDKGKRLRIYYGTQVATKPPTFVIFVNKKELFHFSYERYIVNQIRKEFGLEGTPVRIIAREKLDKEVE